MMAIKPKRRRPPYEKSSFAHGIVNVFILLVIVRLSSTPKRSKNLKFGAQIVNLSQKMFENQIRDFLFQNHPT